MLPTSGGPFTPWSTLGCQGLPGRWRDQPWEGGGASPFFLGVSVRYPPGRLVTTASTLALCSRLGCFAAPSGQPRGAAACHGAYCGTATRRKAKRLFTSQLMNGKLPSACVTWYEHSPFFFFVGVLRGMWGLLGAGRI